MKIEIGVLVELEAARNLLFVSLVLNRLQCHRMMFKPSRALIRQDAVSHHRAKICNRHDAMELSDARVHCYALPVAKNSASFARIDRLRRPPDTNLNERIADASLHDEVDRRLRRYGLQ